MVHRRVNLLVAGEFDPVGLAVVVGHVAGPKLQQVVVGVVGFRVVFRAARVLRLERALYLGLQPPDEATLAHSSVLHLWALWSRLAGDAVRVLVGWWRWRWSRWLGTHSNDYEYFNQKYNCLLD